ncbi:MAG: hypothetical protein LBL72_05450, partial [Candidatus Accumulibacter sp.]|nr:hypothetical protein [Accumulibacter sp.]
FIYYAYTASPPPTQLTRKSLHMDETLLSNPFLAGVLQEAQMKTDRCFKALSPAAKPPLTDLIPDI